MFDFIGSKIKTLAKIITWIGIILSVLMGVIAIVVTHNFSGILIAAVGSLASWISSFLLYGFGEMVDGIQTLCQYRSDQNS